MSTHEWIEIQPRYDNSQKSAHFFLQEEFTVHLLQWKFNSYLYLVPFLSKSEQFKH